MTSRISESLKIPPAASPPKQISEKAKYLMFLQKKTSDTGYLLFGLAASGGKILVENLKLLPTNMTAPSRC